MPMRRRIRVSWPAGMRVTSLPKMVTRPLVGFSAKHLDEAIARSVAARTGS